MGAWRQDGLADSYVGRNVTLTLITGRRDISCSVEQWIFDFESVIWDVWYDLISSLLIKDKFSIVILE
jgi:hypothetical protein